MSAIELAVARGHAEAADLLDLGDRHYGIADHRDDQPLSVPAATPMWQ